MSGHSTMELPFDSTQWVALSFHSTSEACCGVHCGVYIVSFKIMIHLPVTNLLWCYLCFMFLLSDSYNLILFLPPCICAYTNSLTHSVTKICDSISTLLSKCRLFFSFLMIAQWCWHLSDICSIRD